MEIQLKGFIEHNKTLSTINFRLRQRYRCMTRLLFVTDNVLRAIDDRKCTAVVLLEYSKSFDTLDNSFFITNISSSGFGVEARNQIESYLTSRSQVNENVS